MKSSHLLTLVKKYTTKGYSHHGEKGYFEGYIFMSNIKTENSS